MQLAFILYKYFPFGGLQRDFMRIALECQQRGHQIRVYTLIWEGEIPAGFDVRIGPVKAWANHSRNQKFHHWLQADMQQQPVDRVIGFNKMLLCSRWLLRRQSANLAQSLISLQQSLPAFCQL